MTKLVCSYKAIIFYDDDLYGIVSHQRPTPMTFKLAL